MMKTDCLQAAHAAIVQPEYSRVKASERYEVSPPQLPTSGTKKRDAGGSVCGLHRSIMTQSGIDANPLRLLSRYANLGSIDGDVGASGQAGFGAKSCSADICQVLAEVDTQKAGSERLKLDRQLP
jgi:hypothetical protein